MGQTAGLHCMRRPGLSLALLALLLFLPTGWPAAEVACPPCDDFNACTVDSCDTAFGTCRHTPLSCDDGNPCTTDSCTPGQFSTCQHTGLPLGTACDDHNSCSLADVCNGSQQCVGSFLPVGSSCNDGNGCTTSDTCLGGGVCRGDFINAGDSCEDGSLCTSGETCVDEAGSLVCQGSSSCNDSNPCTQDQCDESTGLCAHPPVSCEDGNICTGDTCDPSSGGCTRTFVGGTCNDGDGCTSADVCTSGNCVGTFACDDGVDCTSNYCNRSSPGGVCDNTIQIPGTCDDGNPCTADLCDQSGCHHPAAPGPCTPGNKCLQPFCRLGTCGGFPEITCNDGNLCTLDGCNFFTGCVFTPISCDDQNACTVDSCSPLTGCAHAADSCDDGIACTVDFCDLSGCGHLANCDDGDPCTIDVCDATGCTHVPLASSPSIPLTIQVNLTPNSLLPANHRMVPVTATVTPSDSCGGALSVRLESITSSEPDDAEGSGDGHTTNDVQGAAFGTADFSFALRAERDREGTGRTYRVTYSATDSVGRAAAGSAVAVVPVGHGKGPKGTGGGVPDRPDSDDPGAPKKGGGPGRN